jgi:hypothetical protein
LENTEPVNFPETMRADLAAMTVSARLTRRGLVGALAGAALAPPALAAPALIFPLRLGYARIGPDGFVRLRSDERRYWSELQTRAGGLIETLEPLQPADLQRAAPETDGEAIANFARQLAASRGLANVVLYATQDGQAASDRARNWIELTFGDFRSGYGRHPRATGEALLLDVTGGPAIASVSADAALRSPFNLFDNNRNPERETLAALVMALERRLQSLARPTYDAQLSIAD